MEEKERVGRGTNHGIIFYDDAWKPEPVGEGSVHLMQEAVQSSVDEVERLPTVPLGSMAEILGNKSVIPLKHSRIIIGSEGNKIMLVENETTSEEIMKLIETMNAEKDATELYTPLTDFDSDGPMLEKIGSLNEKINDETKGRLKIGAVGMGRQGIMTAVAALGMNLPQIKSELSSSYGKRGVRTSSYNELAGVPGFNRAERRKNAKLANKRNKGKK
jgi:hypothetical protein